VYSGYRQAGMARQADNCARLQVMDPDSDQVATVNPCLTCWETTGERLVGQESLSVRAGA